MISVFVILGLWIVIFWLCLVTEKVWEKGGIVRVLIIRCFASILMYFFGF